MHRWIQSQQELTFSWHCIHKLSISEGLELSPMSTKIGSGAVLTFAESAMVEMLSDGILCSGVAPMHKKKNEMPHWQEACGGCQKSL